MIEWRRAQQRDDDDDDDDKPSLFQRDKRTETGFCVTNKDTLRRHDDTRGTERKQTTNDAR